MIYYRVPVGLFLVWNPDSRAFNSKAFSESFDEHLCLRLHNSLRDQPDVPGETFRRHQEGFRSMGVYRKARGSSVRPSVLRKSCPSYLEEAEAGACPHGQRSRGHGSGTRASTGRRKPSQRLSLMVQSKNCGGHQQSPVGTEQNESLVCAGFIQKQKPSAWILQQSL